MSDHHQLQRIVVDMKHGLLEIESHTAMLKKRIFDLERQLAKSKVDALSHREHVLGRPVCDGTAGDDRMLPFSFLDQLR